MILDSSHLLTLSSVLTAPVIEVQGSVMNSLKLSSCWMANGFDGARTRTFEFLTLFNLSAATRMATIVLPNAVGATTIVFPFFNTSPARICWYNLDSIASFLSKG